MPDKISSIIFPIPSDSLISMVKLPRILDKTNSVAFSPQANYTDWATVTCWRILVPTFVDRGVTHGQRSGSPTVVNLSFLDCQHTRLFIIFLWAGACVRHCQVNFTSILMAAGLSRQRKQFWLSCHRLMTRSLLLWQLLSCPCEYPLWRDVESVVCQF
jgi:hypothetical protein